MVAPVTGEHDLAVGVAGALVVAAHELERRVDGVGSAGAEEHPAVGVRRPAPGSRSAAATAASLVKGSKVL